MIRSRVAFSAGWVVRLSIGFFTWLAAARIYPASQVGMAASAISAMLICVEVGILGIDAALIAEFPRHRERPALLLNTAITLGAVAACLGGLAFVVAANLGFQALRALSANGSDALVFLALTALQSVWWLMDQASVALGRSDHVPIRAALSVLVTLAAVVALGVAGMTTARSILLAWVLAALTACVIGLVQTSRVVHGYRFRPRLPKVLSRRLFSVGLPNFALTAADIAPTLILPLVAAQVLSARSAAYWYTVWMMSFAAYTVPLSFGLHLFAEVAASPSELLRRTRQTLRTGIAFAAAASLGLIAVGPFVLSILGPAYASHGSMPLRLMALASLPMVLVKAYLYSCRATGHLREATVVAAVAGAAAVASAALLAPTLGLTGIAIAWLGVQVLTAFVAMLRLRVLASGQTVRSVEDLLAA